MPRKSAESLSVITAMPGQRLAPPARLSTEAADLWREVVAGKPHDWFGADSAQLLEAFVRAVISHRAISARVAEISTIPGSGDELANLDRLIRMQQRQAGVMASLGTKLRLTQQSRYTPQAAATAAKKVRGARPWE